MSSCKRILAILGGILFIGISVTIAFALIPTLLGDLEKIMIVSLASGAIFFLGIIIMSKISKRNQL